MISFLFLMLLARQNFPILPMLTDVPHRGIMQVIVSNAVADPRVVLVSPVQVEWPGWDVTWEGGRGGSSPRGADDQNGPESSPRVSVSRRFSV